MKRQVPFKRKFPVTGLRSSNSRLHFQTAKEIASSACICVITIQWFPSFWERKMQCCLDQFPLCLLPYLLQVNRFSRQLNIVSVSWTGEKWPDNFATGEKSRAKDKISLLNCVLFVCVCVCMQTCTVFFPSTILRYVCKIMWQGQYMPNNKGNPHHINGLGTWSWM